MCVISTRVEADGGLDSSHKFDDFRLNKIITDLQLDLDFNTSDSWLHVDSSLLTWKYLRLKCMLFKKWATSQYNSLHFLSQLRLTLFFTLSWHFIPKIHFVWNIWQHPVNLKNKAGKSRLRCLLVLQLFSEVTENFKKHSGFVQIWQVRGVPVTCLGLEIQRLGLQTCLRNWEQRLKTYLWSAKQWLCPTSASRWALQLCDSAQSFNFSGTFLFQVTEHYNLLMFSQYICLCVCSPWLQRACQWWTHWSPGRPGCRGWTVYTAGEVSSLANRLKTKSPVSSAFIWTENTLDSKRVFFSFYHFKCLFPSFVPIVMAFLHRSPVC